jgi:mono/diheme cytochrome c family protein
MERPFLVLALSLVIAINGCKHDPIYPNGYTPGNEPTVSQSCDSDTAYFQNDVLPILVATCNYSGCHNEPNGADGVILSNYVQVMQSGEVRSGRPGESDLYEVLIETRDDKRMPPPPYARLSSEQIATVRKWIEQGALNNKCVENTTDCDTANVPFRTVQTIINSNCVGCHSGGGASDGVNLESYASIRTNTENGRLKGAITHASGYTAMPPGITLPACDILKIEAWINQGMNP